MSGGVALVEALGSAAAALRGGDPVGAAAAFARAGAARRALEQAGAALDPVDLERARALLADCQAAAAPLRASLDGALGRAGLSTRAHRAYRR